MAQPQTVRFFYLATLQAPVNGGGMACRTMWGTVDWPADRPASRIALLTWFMETQAQPEGLGGANVMTWQCEPDAYDVPQAVLRPAG